MKPRPKQTMQNSLKNSEAKGKIYVPITPIDQQSSSQSNPNSFVQSHPQLISNSPSLLLAERHPTQGLRQHPSLFERQESIHNQNQIIELKRMNMELKEKEEFYIEKLIKLEEGLERQYEEFMKLQDLYNELYRSYKIKEEEVSQCKECEEFEESNGRKEVNSLQKVNEFQEENFNRIIESKEKEISQCKNIICLNEEKCLQYQKTVERLCSEISYQKNKEKINDSRVNLSNKIFEELEEYQKQVDNEKEMKIKLEYENKFLRSRHEDLECRVVELEEIVKNKQSEVLKLRQNSIMMSRNNSENKILRSASKSPRKFTDKENCMPKPKENYLVSNLQNENSSLKKELENLKLSLSSSHLRPENFIRHEEFFSFSREDFSNHSSNQETSNNEINKASLSYLTIKEPTDVSETVWKQEEKYEICPKEYFENNERSCELQELPESLEIESLINSTKMNNREKVVL